MTVATKDLGKPRKNKFRRKLQVTDQVIAKRNTGWNREIVRKIERVKRRQKKIPQRNKKKVSSIVCQLFIDSLSSPFSFFLSFSFALHSLSIMKAISSTSLHLQPRLFCASHKPRICASKQRIGFACSLTDSSIFSTSHFSIVSNFLILFSLKK